MNKNETIVYNSCKRYGIVLSDYAVCKSESNAVQSLFNKGILTRKYKNVYTIKESK